MGLNIILCGPTDMNRLEVDDSWRSFSSKLPDRLAGVKFSNAAPITAYVKVKKIQSFSVQFLVGREWREFYLVSLRSSVR